MYSDHVLRPTTKLRDQVQLYLLLGIMLCFAGVAHAIPPITFAAPATYVLSGETQGITTADFDGDGKRDIAVANSTYVSVLYGNGDGTFSAPVNYTVGAGYKPAVVAADVNGDGRPDLLVIDADTSTVVVLINQGNRTFAPAASYATGVKPYGLTVADFNGDGFPDLATANNGDNTLTVLLNNGDGTFGPPVAYGGGSYPASVVAGDFNGDGHIDLAMSNDVSGDIDIYLGDGTGNFTFAHSYGIGDYLVNIRAGDFNHDGKLDLVVSDYFSGQASVLFGNGDGTFQTPATYPANTYPSYGDVADLDGNGSLDILLPNSGAATFTVLQNNGDGTFGAPLSFTSGGTNVRFAMAGDFNGDGLADVVVCNADQGSISVFVNTTRSLSSLTLNPASVIGGVVQSVGTVTITVAAPAEGATVTLTNTNPAATVPPTVTIPPGATSATFPIKTAYVTSVQTGTITATYSGSSQSATLTVVPIGVVLVELIPDPVEGGRSVDGQVTISAPAAPKSLVVTLTSSDPSIAKVPSTLTIRRGDISKTFQLETKKVKTATTVTITATLNGISATRTIQIEP